MEPLFQKNLIALSIAMVIVALKPAFFKWIYIPAIIGAVIGAIALTLLSEGEKYAKLTKPVLAAYTMYLGYTILRNAFVKKDVLKIVLNHK